MQEGIVLRHKISTKGIKVNRAKIEVVANLSPPTNMKGVKSFLGYVGFYRLFTKNFSLISKPLCNMLNKDVAFDFDANYLKAFNR